MTPETVHQASLEASSQGIEVNPEEFRELPPEARVCLAFFGELKGRTKEMPSEITQKIMEFAELEHDEARNVMSELRTENDRHGRRVEFDHNEMGTQFTLTENGIDFIKQELAKLR